MQASLGEVVLAYLRHLLLHEDSITFGAMCVAISSNQLSNLWSPEHWANSRRQKLVIGFLIIVIPLASSVGPASNVLIKPDKNDMKIGVSEIRLKGPQRFFPPYLNSTYIPIDACSQDRLGLYHNDISTGAFRTLANRASCQVTDFESIAELVVNWWRQGGWMASARLGGRTPRELHLNVLREKGTTEPEMIDRQSVATTQQAAMVELLHNISTTFLPMWDMPDHVNYWSSQGINEPMASKHVMRGFAPFVSTKCNGAPMEPLTNPNIAWNETWQGSQIVRFPHFGGSLIDFPVPKDDLRLRINEALVSWYEPGTQYKENVSLLSIVQINKLVYSCSTKATWGVSEIIATIDKEPFIDSISAPFIPSSWADADKWDTPTVAISLDWINTVVPPYIKSSGDGVDVVEKPLENFAYGRNDANWNETREGHSFAPLLSSIIVAGMSRVFFVHDYTSGYPPWYEANFFYNPIANASFHISRDDHTAFIDSYYVGSSYTLQNSWSRWLSVAVLAIYCFITIIYFTCTLISRKSSNSWGSTAEIIALALRSRRPKTLENATAGIEAWKTFREPVAVRERGERLELVFTNEDPEQEVMGKVVTGRAY